MSGKLSGLEVTKREKRVGLLCIILAIVCIISYFVLALFEVEPVQVVTLPSGGLTESIFDSQNLVYKSEESFTVKSGFSNVPFTIDTVEGQRAMVGRANVYKYAPYYFYFSEIAADEQLEDIIKTELTSIISISAEASETEVRVLKEESGHVNGCVAKYYCLEISVSDGDERASHYMCLYRLHFDESVYVTDWDILVGCMSDSYTTEGLRALQALAYSSVGTLRYDASLDK